MHNFSWLYHWQTLIGAAIGGVMGFIGAYWVARSARIRDEIVAGKVIIADLMAIQEKTRALDARNEQLKIKDEENKKQEFALQYIKRKPILSPLFDMYMATVMTCSYPLSVHLALLRKIYLNVEESLTKIEPKVTKAADTATKIKITSYVTADIETIYQGAHFSSKLAECIIPLINNFVLSNFRCVNKLILKPGMNCNCQQLAEKISGEQKDKKGCNCCCCCCLDE